MDESILGHEASECGEEGVAPTSSEARGYRPNRCSEHPSTWMAHESACMSHRDAPRPPDHHHVRVSTNGYASRRHEPVLSRVPPATHEQPVALARSSPSAHRWTTAAPPEAGSTSGTVARPGRQAHRATQFNRHDPTRNAIGKQLDYRRDDI